MTEEKEILTILSKTEYDEVLVRMEKEFGRPQIVKRLTLQCTDYHWVDIDTRIRITDGEAEIIQKVGDYRKRIRTEIIIPLPSDPKIVFDMYTVLCNAIKGEVEVPIMQYENRLFFAKDLEIKLTHQFGKSDGYNCEVEVFESQLNPEGIAKRLDIPIHLPEDTIDFWKNWNETVNLNARELSDTELLEIIEKYLSR